MVKLDISVLFELSLNSCDRPRLLREPQIVWACLVFEFGWTIYPYHMTYNFLSSTFSYRLGFRVQRQPRSSKEWLMVLLPLILMKALTVLLGSSPWRLMLKPPCFYFVHAIFPLILGPFHIHKAHACNRECRSSSKTPLNATLPILLIWEDASLLLCYVHAMMVDF